MNKPIWAFITCACVSLCLGITCRISTVPDDNDDDDGGGDDATYPYVRLDNATATVHIDLTHAGSVASIEADIESGGAIVHLQDGQSVEVNGSELSGPSYGEYRVNVPKQAAYTIRVNEPRLGVIESTINAPGDFAITAPAAGATISLSSGFTLTWSNPDPNISYTVTLRQPARGQTVTLGPFVDDDGGVLPVTVADLASFRHGGTLNLVIEIKRTTIAAAIQGFADGSNIEVQLTDTVTVIPAE